MQKMACDCCGTCCRKGGPALHTEDRRLVETGVLGLGDLITIRRGEYVLQPLTDKPLPAKEEFLKIQGKGTDWCCKFLDNELSTCTIYSNRPLACRLLKCWDTDDVLAVAGRELLNRFSLVPENNPVYSLMKKHDDECPVPDLTSLNTQLSEKKYRDDTLATLTGLVNRDLQIRLYTAKKFHLSIADELFCFGRPIFQLLVRVGISVTESAEGLTLQYSGT